MMKLILSPGELFRWRHLTVAGEKRAPCFAIFPLRPVAFLFIATLFLAACGGGSGSGSSGGSSTISNTPPVVVIADHPGVVNEGETIQLDATGSSDSDGQIVSFAWTQISGTSVTVNSADTSLADFVVPAATSTETMTFRVTVTDDGGLQSSGDMSVVVNPSPIADAGSAASVIEGDTVTLDGSGSSDDIAIASYAWTQVSGPSVTIANPDQAIATFVAPAYTGDLQFRLTVTDSNGAVNSDDVTIYTAVEIYANDFSSAGGPSGWSVVDDSGTPYTSLWQVVSGKYVQQNLVEFTENNPGSFLESYHRGTYSYYSNGSNWDDYTFSVDIKPVADSGIPAGSQDGNDVGIMFRYANSQSYYRLSLSACQSFTRLEKRTASGFETLAVDARGYIEGQTISVAVSVKGSRIVVYINDEPVFGVDDNDPISKGTIALYCQDKVLFDNVRVSEMSDNPEIVIQDPIDYGVSPISGGVLQATAVPTSFPAGASIDFILDGKVTQTVSGSPYQVSFDNVSNGDHSLSITLRDSDGNEMTSDTNERIGVSSEYYLAVGDSITNGKRDEDPNDNVSADGRIVGKQGYEATLSDLLSNDLDTPVIIFNEGIGGDRVSTTYNDRIASILERHPNSKKILLLLGTNDSSHSYTADQFEHDMQNLVDYLVKHGNLVWLAKIPPVYDSNGNPNTTRNDKIVAYNAKIDNITGTAGDKIYPGPDLYTLFDGRFSQFYSSDGVHPNDAGYEEMAYAWRNSVLSAP
jgi:lysophospholipase L1-like esterase